MQLYQRHRRTLTGPDPFDFTVSPGYRYALFIGPFESGEVLVTAVATSRDDTEYEVSLLGDTVPTTGRSIELLATTSTIRITAPEDIDVYIELNVVKGVSNPENYV